MNDRALTHSLTFGLGSTLSVEKLCERGNSDHHSLCDIKYTYDLIVFDVDESSSVLKECYDILTLGRDQNAVY